MNAPITHINCLGIDFPITHTSVTQKNCFRIISVIISGLIVSTVPKCSHSKPGRTQQRSNARRRAQMSAKIPQTQVRKRAQMCTKRAQKSAKERKGALPRQHYKQPGLKQQQAWELRVPSDTKLLLTKNYSEIIIFGKITNLTRNSLKMSFFPGDFESTECLKTYEK